MQAKMYSYQFGRLKLKYIVRSFFTIKFKSEKNKHTVIEKHVSKTLKKIN